GAVNNSEGAGNPDGGGVGVTSQGMFPPRTLGQVVVTASVNVTLGPSGLGPHTVSRVGRGRNLLQSRAVTKLKISRLVPPVMSPAPTLILISIAAGGELPSMKHWHVAPTCVHLMPAGAVQGGDVGNWGYEMLRKPLHVCCPCASTGPGSSSEEPSVDRAPSAM